MDKLKLLSEMKVLEGMLLHNAIVLRWVKENMAQMGEAERERVAKLLAVVSTALRGQVEEAKEAGL